MAIDLPLIWAAIVGLAVAMYVILDGFDLGIGVLLGFTHQPGERDQMVNAIVPFWDGNETWLVLGGGALWVAFPRAYAVIMPAFYVPVITMLLALVFRGVAFEFRNHAVASKPFWDYALIGGSALAALCQGAILGGLIQGINMENGAYAGGAFDWATPFTALCALGVLSGYALLGAAWLVLKTEGAIATRARRQAKSLLLVVLAFMAAVSVWTPLAFERIAERWFAMPNILLLWPVPFATAFAAFIGWRALDRGYELTPFLAAIALFLLGYLGLVISVFPYLVPPNLTVWEAASPRATQVFMLIGTLVLLPIILGYVAFVYWIFRGKVRADDSYH